MKNWLVGLMIAAASVAAQAEAPRLRLFGSLAYGWGGEQVLRGTYVDGSGNRISDFELLAGTGWTWTIGADMRLFGPLALQLSVGEQRNRIPGSDGDYDFFRNPVEFLVFYSMTEQVRLGLGAHKTFRARLTGTGRNPGSWDFDSSPGSVLEVQYLFTAPTKERGFVSGMNFRIIREDFFLAPQSGGTGTAIRADQTAIGLFFYY